MDTKRKYILWDGRACNDAGTEDASVLVFCDSESEAFEYKGDFDAMACYSYRDNGKNELSDERWEWDYYDGDEAA